ncbi:MAG: MCE family protein [Verrucomicrobiae bacterium]|nr:MCE family protein [Verrucomicrobiae bacterium]
MSHKASPAIIGLFTLVGLLFGAASLVIVGAGKYFESTDKVMLFFDKSAYGLQVGSDVRFGGVRIGRVSSINVIVDTAGNRKIIPVVVELAKRQLENVTRAGGGVIDFSSAEGVHMAVAEGLRAGMKQQSLVTGQLYIEFDVVPDTPGFVYEDKTSPPYPVIPTIPTEIDELIAGISDGLKKINSLNLESVMTEMKNVLVSAKEQIDQLDFKSLNDNVIRITEDVQSITGDEKLKSAVANLDSTLAEMKAVTSKVNDGIDPVMDDLAKVVESANTSLVKIEEAVEEIKKSGDPRAPLLLNLQEVLRHLERTSRGIEELTSDLKRNPDSLIRGKTKP